MLNTSDEAGCAMGGVGKVKLDGKNRITTGSTGTGPTVPKYGDSKNPSSATNAKFNISFDIANNMQAIIDSKNSTIESINAFFTKHGIKFNTSDFTKYKEGSRVMSILLLDAFLQHMNISYDELLGRPSARHSSMPIPSWIWDEEKTMGIEITAKEIWIITPDFYYDVHPEYRQLVDKNVLENKCMYKYIYKATRQNKVNVNNMFKTFASVLEERNDLVTFLPVEEMDFHWITEQIIFNPNNSSSRKAIIVNPTGEINIAAKLNIEMSDSDCREFRALFQSYWERSFDNHETFNKWKHNQA